MNAPQSTEELLKLARFQILDHRNGSENAKDRLLAKMADEIERLRALVLDLQATIRRMDDVTLAKSRKLKELGFDWYAQSAADVPHE